MLAFMKLSADFSRECAGRRIGHSLFATNPTAASQFAHCLWRVSAMMYGTDAVLSAPFARSDI
jgi:hypothetical protein